MKLTFTFLLTFTTFLAYSQCDFTTTTSTTDVSCFGDSDGSAFIEVAGGMLPYTYSWSNGQTTASANGLSVGVYSVTVTDATGCAEATQLTISEPPPLTGNLSVLSDVLCFGGSSGSASINVVGGTPNSFGIYTYQWSDGQTTPTVSGLSAGVYSVTATDDNGCNLTAEIEVGQTSELSLAVEGDFTIECGDEFATMSAVVTGGTPPYTYEWTNANIVFGGDNVTLLPGIYGLIVIDANGCFSIITLEVYAAVSYGIDTTPASCDAADGTAEVVPINNPTNLSYAWSTGGTGQTETGLAQGWYSVTVTDDTCSVHRNFYVDEDVSCKVVLGGYVINDDANPDCVDDADSEKIENIMLIVNDSLVAYTDTNGYYEFTLDAGTYEVEAILGNQHEALCPAPAVLTVSLPNDGMVSTDNNFYLKYSSYEDVCVTAAQGAARPGFDLSYSLFICNYGGETVTNGTVTFVHDSILPSPIFAPPADTYDPITYTATWNYTDFEPNECFNISVTTTVPVGTPLGTILDGELTANPIATDDNPTNNIYEWNQTVTGSYDPNDKRGFIGNANEWGGDILEEDVRFNYNLRFQNVGTDTAFTVVVRDSLDLDVFDIESIQVGATSHPYRLEFEDDNVLVFWFENILLVDSTANEPDSHGFATFTINRFPDLPIGTEIKNSAAIFFDFNAPVITNTTIHTISLPVSTTHPNLDITSNIYPNPISNETIVSYQLEKAETLSVSIVDQLGQTCFTLLDNERQSAGNHTLSLRGEDLPSGLYLLQIITAEGRVCKKFVK